VKYAAVALKKITFLFCLRLLTFQANTSLYLGLLWPVTPVLGSLQNPRIRRSSISLLMGKVLAVTELEMLDCRAKCIASCLCSCLLIVFHQDKTTMGVEFIYVSPFFI